MRYALCDVTDDARLNFDGLDVNEGQRQYTREQRKDYVSSIDKGCIPFAQMSSYKSSSSKYVVVRIRRLVDCRGQ